MIPGSPPVSVISPISGGWASNEVSSSNLSNYQFSNVDTGLPRDRTVYVACFAERAGVSSITECLIAGDATGVVEIARLGGASTQGELVIYAKRLTAATASLQPISFRVSAAQRSGHLQVFAVYGNDSVTPLSMVNNSGTSPTTTANVYLPAGSIALCLAAVQNAASGNNVVWTGATETSDSQIENALFSSAVLTKPSNSTITATITSASTNRFFSILIIK